MSLNREIRAHYDSSMTGLDAIDAQIFLELDDDPRRPVVSMADRLGLARRTVQSRLARLEEAGMLRAHSTRLLPGELGFPIAAIISADLDQSRLAVVVETLEAMPEVLEVAATSGDQDIVARVVARDTDHLYLLGQDILACPGVRRTRTALILRDLVPYRTRPLVEAGHRSGPTVVSGQAPPGRR
jgi:DNA-binding Lrp family transcriptional regulator